MRESDATLFENFIAYNGPQTIIGGVWLCPFCLNFSLQYCAFTLNRKQGYRLSFLPWRAAFCFAFASGKRLSVLSDLLLCSHAKKTARRKTSGLNDDIWGISYF